jgi:hypothetical protein
MLELIVGVPLTIAAWKRGWKGWALLPMPLAWVTMFIAGLILGSTAGPGTTVDDLLPAILATALLVYVVAFGSLIMMIIKPKKAKECKAAAASARVSAISFCTHCGKQQPGEPLFCRDCGARLGSPGYQGMDLKRQETQQRALHA